MATRKWDQPSVDGKLRAFVRELFEQLVEWAMEKMEDLVGDELETQRPSVNSPRSAGTPIIRASLSRLASSHPPPQPSPAPSSRSNLSTNSTDSIRLYDSTLDEYLQRHAMTASFIDVKCGGPDHMPVFQVNCMMAGRVIGSGLGWGGARRMRRGRPVRSPWRR